MPSDQPRCCGNCRFHLWGYHCNAPLPKSLPKWVIGYAGISQTKTTDGHDCPAFQRKEPTDG